MVKIKICGITNIEDTLAAARWGADAVGLNFYARSPRCIDVATAAAILRDLPPFLEPVGLFVNEPTKRMFQQAAQLNLRTLQLHRDSWQETIPVQNYRLIPAFPVRDPESLTAITRYLDQARSKRAMPAAILVDAHVPGSYGGTGQTAPWELLASFQPGIPLILAGGLTPDNVAQAVRLVRPYAVDVASGVESSPGRKNADKMRKFIDQVREASQEMSST